MSDAFIDTYSALDARLKMLDTITNNLANANTTGFKRDFGHILQKAVGVEASTQVDTTPGDITATGNELDVALNGPGFFVLDTPNGQRYTRSGNFALNSSGDLVTKDGMKVMSTSNSAITPGEGKVVIRDGGIVTVDGNEVATLKVVTFNDATRIQKEGGSQFSWSGAANGIQAISEAPVKAGYLERSNVNPIDEMVRLVTASREFESVQHALKTMLTDMNGKLISEFGKLG